MSHWRRRSYFVYIISNANRTLYIGVTCDLNRRVVQHREKRHNSFSGRYSLTDLVYFEAFQSPSEAIAREKQLKGWRRDKKIKLIEAANPGWADLFPVETW